MTGLPGEWSFRRCTNPACGLLWLDPAPVPEDLPKAYRDYFTHGRPEGTPAVPRGDPGMALRGVRTIGLVLRRFPSYRAIQAEHVAREATYLGDLTPGRLLEVGCGNGSRLATLKEQGWQLVGQEVDSEAVTAARSRGWDVRLGPLKDLHLEAASFDALVMVHVIEHMVDPVDELSECSRVLKPGGRLIVVTPNAASYGHRRFGRLWQGLDPPRHLYVFTRRTLGEVALRAGFEGVATWTTEANAYSSFAGTLGNLLHGRYHSSAEFGPTRRLQSRAFQYWAALMQSSDTDSGEECVLRAMPRKR